MSTIEPNPISESTSTATSSPGTLLQEARERAGLSQQEVAKELHMSLTKVKAIEANEYTQLKSDTFIRGYLRAYANYLKLDCAPVIQAYQIHARTKGWVPESQYQIPKETNSKKLWIFVGGLFAFLLVLWLISVWFFDNHVERPHTAPAVIAPVAPPTAMTSDNENVEKTLENTEQETDVIDEQAVDSTPPKNTETPVDNQPQEAEPVAAMQSAATLDTLRLTFNAECWLEVSDSQGDVLATELQRADTSVTLTGKAPFTVKLGDARAVQMTLNGTDVAINPPATARVMILNVGE